MTKYTAIYVSGQYCNISLAYARVKSDYMHNESFPRLVILYTALVTALHSRILHPCHMVSHW